MCSEKRAFSKHFSNVDDLLFGKNIGNLIIISNTTLLLKIGLRDSL
jgi:hypothetical protein